MRLWMLLISAMCFAGCADLDEREGPVVRAVLEGNPPSE